MSNRPTLLDSGTMWHMLFNLILPGRTLIRHGQAGHELRVPGRKSDISENYSTWG
jgi:hypothetical protein